MNTQALLDKDAKDSRRIAHREYMRKYRASNRDAINLKNRERYKQNRANHLAKLKQYRAKADVRASRSNYSRRYYTENKDAILDYQQLYNKRKREFIAERTRKRYSERRKMMDSLKARPCVDCKTQYHPYVMEFDHVPERGPKSFNLSDATYNTVEDILKEVAKCDVVCSNCHRKRTLVRRGDDPTKIRITLP